MDWNSIYLKGKVTVQIHFNYSYKLRIFFHTVRYAYRKMKDAKKLCASIKLRKKEIFEDGFFEDGWVFSNFNM